MLFLMFNYEDACKSDSMYNSLVAEFISNGHDVSVVAFEKSGRDTGIYSEGIAKVLRVKTLPLMNVGPLLKGFSNLLLPHKYKQAIRKYLNDRRFDLIITPTPPITLTRLAATLKLRNNARLYLILRDIFPQNAVDVGFLKKWNPLYKYFRRMERNLYEISDSIGCMTQGNIDYILKHNPDLSPEKLHILPNWNKPSAYQTDSDEEIKEKYCLKDKFIVIFGGTIGVSQKVDNVVDLAKLHMDKKDLIFLVVGKGTHKKYLERKVKTEGLENILIFDYLPRMDYEKIVSVANVGLISLNEKFTIPNTPSRTLAYYNFKKPIFAITDPNTDYGNVLKMDQSGLSCIYGDWDCYVNSFNELYRDGDLRKQMGENGFKVLHEKYTPERSYQIIMESLSVDP